MKKKDKQQILKKFPLEFLLHFNKRILKKFPLLLKNRPEIKLKILERIRKSLRIKDKNLNIHIQWLDDLSAIDAVHRNLKTISIPSLKRKGVTTDT